MGEIKILLIKLELYGTEKVIGVVALVLRTKQSNAFHPA